MSGNNTNRAVVIVNVFPGLGSLKVFTRWSSNILTVARRLECSVSSISAFQTGMFVVHGWMTLNGMNYGCMQ
jgi:hypothetical protein